MGMWVNNMSTPSHKSPPVKVVRKGDFADFTIGKDSWEFTNVPLDDEDPQRVVLVAVYQDSTGPGSAQTVTVGGVSLTRYDQGAYTAGVYMSPCAVTLFAGVVPTGETATVQINNTPGYNINACVIEVLSLYGVNPEPVHYDNATGGNSSTLSVTRGYNGVIVMGSVCVDQSVPAGDFCYLDWSQDSGQSSPMEGTSYSYRARSENLYFNGQSVIAWRKETIATGSYNVTIDQNTQISGDGFEAITSVSLVFAGL